MPRTAPEPQYGAEHKRIRAALIARGDWLGRPCPRCGKPMLSARGLDLDHKTDGYGRRTGGYNGLAHARCNRGAAMRELAARAALANAGRPEEAAAQARKQRRDFRAQFERAQDGAPPAPAEAGRDW